MKEKTSVADIMDEIRQGLSDTSLSEATRAESEQLASLQGSLRQAHAHAPVLGRCGGSLRGRLCKCLSPLVKPIIDQIDLFHGTLIRLLEKLVADAPANAENRARLQDLEKRMQQIEEQSKRDT